MLSTLIVLFTIALIIVSVLVVLVILMQRPNADAGMGASLGGGAAESAFGGETGNVLTRVSVRGIVTFFLLTFSLFIANIYLHSKEEKTTGATTPSLSAIVNSASTETPAATETPKAEETSKSEEAAK